MAEPRKSTSRSATASPAAAASPTGSAPPAASPGQLEALEDPPEEDDADSALGTNESSFTESISSSIFNYRKLNGRTYHSDRGGSDYWGANDERQNNMLDIQHHNFTLLLGNKLYLAPISEEVEKVLDVGTGTGAWAIDFADEHPGAEVIGTDLSPIQPTWVPPNVKFQIDDFTQPWTFPENSFDFVHIRWLSGAVPDWNALFQKAHRALKPGGWIESFDVDSYFDSDDGTLTEQTAAARWRYIIEEGAKKLGIPSSFAVVSDNLQRPGLEAQGFINIEEVAFKVPYSEWAKDPKLREIGLFARAALEADTEGAVGLLASHIGWTPTEISVFAAHLRKETRSRKVHAYYHARLVYAQKPEAE